MADIQWPGDLAPFLGTFYLQPHVGRSESPFTRQQKIYGLSAPRWVARVNFRGGYNGAVAQAGFGPRLDALIAEMEGGAQTISFWDFRRPGLAEWESIEPFTDDTYFDDGEGFSDELIMNAAVAQGDTSMTLPGAVSSGLFPGVGYYVGGDGRPHIVTRLYEDGDDVVITVKPPFGDAIDANMATFVRVQGTFRITGDDAGANPTEVGQLSAYDFELVEAL